MTPRLDPLGWGSAATERHGSVASSPLPHPPLALVSLALIVGGGLLAFGVVRRRWNTPAITTVRFVDQVRNGKEAP
jgi:hypothetical protein